MSDNEEIQHFDTQEAAIEWMDEKVDDPCTDNYRVGYYDDDDTMDDFHHQEARGCCGSFDFECFIGGRLARVGCNYGH